MKIAVFGMGYVGCVSAACLAAQGHHVVGVDVNAEKVERIRNGESPILESDVPELIAAASRAGRLTATGDPAEGVLGADVSLICVGTPSNENGSLALDSVRKVSRQIGAALASARDFHVIAVRSTMLPDAVAEGVVKPIENESGGRVGRDFGVGVNPEFLREGSAVADYKNPPFTLIGADDDRSRLALAKLYSHLEAPIVHTDLGTAAMVKYASNAFHALKVCFANEVGQLSKGLGVDGAQVMEIFTRDKHLNISDRYLRPGFAFGGSCLPKDLRAMAHRARSLDLDLHVLNSVLQSNRRHVESARREVVGLGRKRIGILGLSFKSGTDDLRESPMVDLVEQLIGQGYDLRILDPAVSLANLVGTNREYVEKTLPHVAALLVSDPIDLVEHAEVVVVAGDDPEFQDVLRSLRPQQMVIDLRCSEGRGEEREQYRSLCR